MAVVSSDLGRESSFGCNSNGKLRGGWRGCRWSTVDGAGQIKHGRDVDIHVVGSRSVTCDLGLRLVNVAIDIEGWRGGHVRQCNIEFILVRHDPGDEPIKDVVAARSETQVHGRVAESRGSQRERDCGGGY